MTTIVGQQSELNPTHDDPSGERAPADSSHEAVGQRGDRLPERFQRLESAALAATGAVAFVDLGFTWWWLFALFLVFDLSLLGYLSGPRMGAWTYNAVHSYIGPAALGVLAVVDGARWAAFVALSWAFHIAIDRLCGYGLKFRDHFDHTHLGEVGRTRRNSHRRASGEREKSGG